MGLLADEIQSERQPRTVRTRLDVVLASLNDDDRADLIAALDDSSISPAAISRALKRRGIDLHRDRIRHYRGTGS